MAWDRKVPFDTDGNQEHYPSLYRTSMWRDNYEFDTEMEFVTFRRGRSAAYGIFMNLKTGTTVTVFMKELEHIMRHISHGRVRGRWTFVKRGQNYGCKLIG